MPNFSPQINSGLPPLNITPMSSLTSRLSPYSAKKIVSSSSPVREKRNMVKNDAVELERKLDQFEVDITNNPINKLLKE